MKIITSDDMPNAELAQLAIDSYLYHSPFWTLINCLDDVIENEDIAKTTQILILQDESGENIGIVYHNDVYSDNYWNTNIQMFIKEKHRGKGYAKLLYKELNSRLIKQNFIGKLKAGEGVRGSITFWDKMHNLYSNNESEYLDICVS